MRDGQAVVKKLTQGLLATSGRIMYIISMYKSDSNICESSLVNQDQCVRTA